MTNAPAKPAAALALTFVVFAVLSNTVGDGNLFGGNAFFIWVLAALGLIVLGVQTLRKR